VVDPRAAQQLLGHEVHELALVVHVPVERRPGDAEPRRDPPERHRLQAALGQQGQGRVDDRVAGHRGALWRFHA
jgi:hypothetical protein